MILQFEIQFIQALNQLANQHPLADAVFMKSTRLALVKMFVPVAVLWYLWFQGDGNRRKVLRGISGAVLAMLLSRLIQNFSPHRPRPAVSGEFAFTMPSGAIRLDWSSFPSDTAALGFALAATAFAASRRLGWVSIAWVIAFACFPRLYGGYHYPSDLVAGGLIGWFCVWLASVPTRLGDRACDRVLAFERGSPGIFYFLAFAVGYQLVTLFDDVRMLADLLWISTRALVS